ncbi:GerAB/ArcD/ProY family transporter [Brevibacillus fulvus]|uniref:Membrane protein YkvI n=1 Tax=Brevibacillus fulvus TaxID=1125967 RepID=A0A938XZP2_9BACL|nr:GerAB/ArcD/ProY family transporter [Brevibacillus fulvus]MBM7590533.1 putative membrane protein YkvI [Brevibacillus fulvus]
MQKSVKETFQIAFTYIGTVVGAGFASGKEIIEFFAQYGTQGLIGIILAALLFVWAGTRVMLVAHRIQADSFHELNLYLFGKTVGTLFNFLLVTITIGTTSVMLAAAGSLFSESLHLPAQIGIWFSMLMIFLVTTKGLNAIHSVNSIFVPILISFTFLVFWNSQMQEPAQAIILIKEPWVWLTSPLYYVALNVSLTQGILAPIGKRCSDVKPLIWGGLLGGLGIGALLLLAFFSISPNLSLLQHLEMPMIFLLQNLGHGFSLLFSLVVYAEIFSSLVANVFALKQQVKSLLPLPQSVIILVILLICYSISFVGFGSLVHFLYPLFGQLVGLLLFVLFWQQWNEWKQQLR